jgi:WD40 repeat protein
VVLVRFAIGGLKVWDEESGELHRQLVGAGDVHVSALATFLSPDGQQPRLVAGSNDGQLHVYDPEAGSVLHRLEGNSSEITNLACIASSSAAPHHPRLVSASCDNTATVWDGETGEWLADLGGHRGKVTDVAAWTEHTEGHDRIATCDLGSKVVVWGGEAFTPLRAFGCSSPWRLLAFKSAGGAHRLLVALASLEAGGPNVQVFDPEEGRLLHDSIPRDYYSPQDVHLFESSQGRHLLATKGKHIYHPRHPGITYRTFIDVWDPGEAPPRASLVRGAHKHG